MVATRARRFAAIFLWLASFSSLTHAQEQKAGVEENTLKGKMREPLGARVSTKTGYYSDDDQLTVITPMVSFSQKIYDTTVIGFEYDADVMTAATVDVRTAATSHFKETRHGLGFTASHRIRPWETEFSSNLRLSRELDWTSITLGGGLQKDFFAKNTTAGGGYTYVGNAVGRSQTPYSNFIEELHIHALNGSLLQLISKDTYIQIAATGISALGYQASVYRYVPIFLKGAPNTEELGEESLLDGTVSPLMRPAENVPQERYRGALVGRLNHHFSWDTFMALGYRIYSDSWGIQSHTLDGKAYQKLPAGFTLRLRNRLYRQKAAWFYEPIYEVATVNELPEFITTDKELGSFGYDLLGVKLVWELPPPPFLESLSVDIKADIQWTLYDDFLYLPMRTAHIFQAGVSCDL